MTTATDDPHGHGGQLSGPVIAACAMRWRQPRRRARATSPSIRRCLPRRKTIQLGSGLTVPATDDDHRPDHRQRRNADQPGDGERRRRVQRNFSVFTVNSGVTGAAINNLIITNGYSAIGRRRHLQQRHADGHQQHHLRQ